MFRTSMMLESVPQHISSNFQSGAYFWQFLFDTKKMLAQRTDSLYQKVFIGEFFLFLFRPLKLATNPEYAILDHF